MDIQDAFILSILLQPIFLAIIAHYVRRAALAIENRPPTTITAINCKKPFTVPAHVMEAITAAARDSQMTVPFDIEEKEN